MSLFKGPGLASCVAAGNTEKQGHCQVFCASRGGPSALSKTAVANLDCVSVENAVNRVFVKSPHFSRPILDGEMSTELS